MVAMMVNFGVVPRILAFKSYEDMMTTKITYRELANAIIEADTADWAEPYAKLFVIVFGLVSKISLIIEKNGGGKVMVVSHGLTISFLLSLIDASLPMQMALENGSVTTLTYEKEHLPFKELMIFLILKREKDR